MRDDTDITRAMELYGDTVWRVCLLRLGSRSDAQDALQDTFLTYATHEKLQFNSEEHRRAWLIRVATNRCIDMQRAHAKVEALDDSYADLPSIELACQPDSALWEVAQALEQLPPNQRQAIYLTACEGYTAAESASIMNAPLNTVYSWINRGKQRLREVLS